MKRYNESLMNISSVLKAGWLYLGMIQREVIERVDNGMYDRKRDREREHHGRNNRDRKKTERGSERKEWGEVLKGPPRVSSIAQAPQPSLFLSG